MGRTLLYVAAENGHLDTVKYLIEEQPCDPGCLDESNATPLHLAAVDGHLNVIKYLTKQEESTPSPKIPMATLHSMRLHSSPS